MKKITIKNIYLILVITVGLISLGVGSTYAMFTASAEIDNPISISSNLTYDSDIMEIIEVTIDPVSTKYITLNAENTTSSTLNYVSFYISDSEIEIGKDLSTASPVGTIGSSSSKSIGLYLRNTTGSPITIEVGVASSIGNVVLADNMKMINNELSSVNLVDYLTTLYTNSSKTVTVNNSINYNYGVDASLMNDRLGGATSSLDGGNIRYYGKDPNNYVYFNCADYDNPSASTCDLWRIIGVFDNKVKLFRVRPSGTLSWDNSASSVNDGYGLNDWSKADLMKILNPEYESNKDLDGSGNTVTVNNSLYWGAKKGSCYTWNGNQVFSNECDFTDGIKNDVTRGMVANTTWNLGGAPSNAVYPNQVYASERGTTVYSGRATSWLGRVALMYPSDYGYGADFRSCTNKKLSEYGSSECLDSNWLDNSGKNLWLLTHNCYHAYNVWSIAGGTPISDAPASNGRDFNPVLYLDTDVLVQNGTGSSSDPYRIKPKYLTSSVKASEYIKDLYNSNVKKMVTNNNISYNYASRESLMNDRLGGTTSSLDGGNIRYYGKDPNNYVYFNCTDYNNPSASTCELWRIIGVFDDKVKLFRVKANNLLAWDTSASSVNSGWGLNDWSKADLMKLLNPGYESNKDLDGSGNTVTVNNSIYWTSSKGFCYTYNNNMYFDSCDYTLNGSSGSGIKNDATRKMIANTMWNLGGASSNAVYPNQVYASERGTAVYPTRATSWTGRVALMYPSDYGYGVDFRSCTNKKLSEYGSSECISNNYLYNDGSKVWLLTHNYNHEYQVWEIADGVPVVTASSGANNKFNPVLYLNTDVNFKGGNGNYYTPYIIAS